MIDSRLIPAKLFSSSCSLSSSCSSTKPPEYSQGSPLISFRIALSLMYLSEQFTTMISGSS